MYEQEPDERSDVYRVVRAAALGAGHLGAPPATIACRLGLDWLPSLQDRWNAGMRRCLACGEWMDREAGTICASCRAF